MRCMKYAIQQTEVFAAWHLGLRDLRARAAISRRIDTVQTGTLGDVRPVGEGVSELRVDVGLGYRLYFTLRERTVVFLLCGGDKRTQAADIKRAKNLAKELEP